MDIWNVDARQEQKWLTWAELCYLKSISNTLFYPLVSIMLLSHNRVTTTFTIKFEINNITSTIKDSCEGYVNQNTNEIAPSDYAMDICIFHWLSLAQKYVLLKDLVAHNQEKKISILWHLVGDISHFQCDANHVILKWPKTFCGRCMVNTYFDFSNWTLVCDLTL